jgi:hypothetical protein
LSFIPYTIGADIKLHGQATNNGVEQKNWNARFSFLIFELLLPAEALMIQKKISMQIVSILRSSFCAAAILLAQDVFAQMTTQFLEPNISITYDTSRFRVNLRDHSKFRVKDALTEIQVTASTPEENPLTGTKKLSTTAELEAYYKIELEKFKKDPGAFSLSQNEIKEFDQQVKKVDNFRGFGFVEILKRDQKPLTQVFLRHVSPNDHTSIYLRSYEQKPLANQYLILTEFLKGFKSYSAAELAAHEAAIRKKYTVVVSKSETVPVSLQKRAKEYIAIVRTNEPMQDRIKEVYVLRGDGYGEIFVPDENGEIYIAAKSNNKGMIERTGRLIIISSIGKHISIPFTFQFLQQ